MSKKETAVSIDFVTAAELRDRDESGYQIPLPTTSTKTEHDQTVYTDAQDGREYLQCDTCGREVSARSGQEKVPHTPECPAARSEERA